MTSSVVLTTLSLPSSVQRQGSDMWPVHRVANIATFTVLLYKSPFIAAHRYAATATTLCATHPVHCTKGKRHQHEKPSKRRVDESLGGYGRLKLFIGGQPWNFPNQHVALSQRNTLEPGSEPFKFRAHKNVI
ncbi:hypothetical protein RB195_017948 [Necator americanus]|uniref:Uncharacterized protein n=1 Tax=Necator americanus TaxID=51031 RepID=A0ABR1C9W5_NECAM